METIVVTDVAEDWAFIKPYAEIVEAKDYLTSNDYHQNTSLRVINLCENYGHQTIGYYVSLLAQARDHKVIPSVESIQDSLNIATTKYIPEEVDEEIQHSLHNIKTNEFTFSLYFGQNMAKCHDNLAKCLHGLFPLPLFKIYFEYKKNWRIKSLVVMSLKDVPPHHQDFMQQASLTYLSKKRFHQWRKKKRYYNLAILVDPSEPNAPSNAKALERFVSTGESMGLNVDFIEKRDNKTSEYDALFIRATTAVNHFTYRIARRAAQENLVVIDDPQSIVKCSNKVYLAELLQSNQILVPETVFISRYDKEMPNITFPCVLKLPESAFSQGVIKISDMKCLQKSLGVFFKTSELVVAQPFLPTEFDWRIGVLDNKAIFACRYLMAKDHWQIYNWHARSTNQQQGGHETFAVEDVPEDVLKTALKATKLIGDGLYGVDIKTVDNINYVIEINDNPNVDFGIEDQVMGDELYQQIISVFINRIQRKHEHAKI